MSTDGQMPELGDHAQAYLDANATIVDINSGKFTGPQDTLEPTLRKAQRLLKYFNVAEAEADFAEALTPVVDPAIEEERAELQDMLSDPEFSKYIDPVKVQADIDALPEPKSPFSEHDQEAAAVYFISKFVGELLSRGETSGVIPRPTPSSGDNGPTPPTNPNDTPDNGADRDPSNPEQDGPKQLHIKHYAHDNMLVLNDTVAIPLARYIGVSNWSADEETLLEDYRLSALKVIAESDEELIASQIWERIDVTGKPYADVQKIWNTQFNEYLLETLQFDGQPLIIGRKPGESGKAKRRYYSLNPAFDISFEELDEDSGIEQHTVFKLPNGKVMGGKAGVVMHLLLRADADNPLVSQDLFDKGVITEEEFAQTKSSRGSVLSSNVNSIRSTLREYGIEHMFAIGMFVDESRTTHYWAERVDQEKLKQAELVHEAHLGASYIWERNDLLTKLGIETISEPELMMLKDADALAGRIPDEEDKKTMRLRAYRAIEALNSEEALLEFLHVDLEDPRWGLMNYLTRVRGQGDEAVKLFDCALRAPSKLIGKPGSDEITRIEYQVSGRGTVNVPREGVQVGQFGKEMLSSVDQTGETVVHQNENGNGSKDQATGQPKPNSGSKPNNGADPDPNLNPERHKSPEEVKFERAVTREVKTAIRQMHSGGLDKKGGAGWSHVDGVFPGLSRNRNRVLKNSGKLATPTDIIKLVLAKSDNDEIAQATTGEQAKAVERLVKDEYARHEQGLERAIQARGRRRR